MGNQRKDDTSYDVVGGGDGGHVLLPNSKYTKL